MSDQTALDLHAEGDVPHCPARWSLIARGVLAVVVGAALVWALLMGATLGFFALLLRGGPALLGAVALVFGAGPVGFVLGGIVARLASRIDWRPGWLSLGAAWLYAIAALLLPFNRIITLPTGIPMLPPSSPYEDPSRFTVHLPGWALFAIVLPAFAYGGDRLICYLGRVRRPARPV